MHIVELSEFVGEIPQTNALNYRNTVIVVPIDGEMGKNSRRSPFPLRLNACAILLVIEGEMTLVVDYKVYDVEKNGMAFLIEHHIVNDVSVSSDFRGFHILIDNDFFKKSTHGDKPPTEGVIYNARQNPVLSFSAEEFKCIIGNVKNLSFNMMRSKHNFQNSLIVNNVPMFAYEIWNKSAGFVRLKVQNAYEECAFRFFDLVFANFKEQHEVSFYAELLCITPIQLSRAVKRVMGKSALQVIHDIIMIEAKIQLRKLDMSVQRVADYLNFSDQASFSKFFKKHIGVSPMMFKHDL